MTALPKRIFDRRFYPRTLINGDIKLTKDQDTRSEQALILNISQTGVLIGTNSKIDMQTQLNLHMESERENEDPIEITAEVIRSAEKSDECKYTYGCLILEAEGV